MKKLATIIALMSASYLSAAQGVMDLANNAQCETQENLLKPILKSTEHPKRSLKPDTWIRLSEAYANYTTACGRDSTSGVKAWEAIQKAQELDTDGGDKSKIEEVMHSDLMYSAVMNQGAAHYNAGNMEQALKLFLIGTEVSPKDSTSTLYAASVANQLGEYDAATKAYTQYIDEAHGTDPSAFYTLSVIARKQDDVDGAIKWLKKGIEVTDSKDLRGELVNTYIQTDRLEEAINDLKALVEKDPSNVGALLNLGLLYDNEGNKELAMETYQKVLKLDPDNYDCNFSIAVIHFNAAVKIKNEVDAMDMKTYQAEGKAIEDKACAEFAKAKPYFDKCVEIKPGEQEVTKSLESLNTILTQCAK